MNFTPSAQSTESKKNKKKIKKRKDISKTITVHCFKITPVIKSDTRHLLTNSG